MEREKKRKEEDERRKKQEEEERKLYVKYISITLGHRPKLFNLLILRPKISKYNVAGRYIFFYF